MSHYNSYSVKYNFFSLKLKKLKSDNQQGKRQASH